jgi:hypothetical protein
MVFWTVSSFHQQGLRQQGVIDSLGHNRGLPLGRLHELMRIYGRIAQSHPSERPVDASTSGCQPFGREGGLTTMTPASARQFQAQIGNTDACLDMWLIEPQDVVRP